MLFAHARWAVWMSRGVQIMRFYVSRSGALMPRWAALDVGLGGENASEFTGAYDAAGNLVVHNFPGGWTASSTFDIEGNEKSQMLL